MPAVGSHASQRLATGGKGRARRRDHGISTFCPNGEWLPTIRQASAWLFADAAFGTDGDHLHDFMGGIMGRISPNRVGLSVAAVLAGWHVVWSLLIAFGAAQRVLDFALSLHGMKAESVVSPFNLATASLLVLVTAVIGYVSGAVGALTWNCLHSWCAGTAVCKQPTAGSAQSSPRHAA